MTRFNWKDTDTLLEIDGSLIQLRHGESYEVNPDTQPQLYQLILLKIRLGSATFTDDDPETEKPLDQGIPGGSRPETAVSNEVEKTSTQAEEALLESEDDTTEELTK